MPCFSILLIIGIAKPSFAIYFFFTLSKKNYNRQTNCCKNFTSKTATVTNALLNKVMALIDCFVRMLLSGLRVSNMAEKLFYKKQNIKKKNKKKA